MLFRSQYSRRCPVVVEKKQLKMNKPDRMKPERALESFKGPLTIKIDEKKKIHGFMNNENEVHSPSTGEGEDHKKCARSNSLPSVDEKFLSCQRQWKLQDFRSHDTEKSWNEDNRDIKHNGRKKCDDRSKWWEVVLVWGEVITINFISELEPRAAVLLPCCELWLTNMDDKYEKRCWACSSSRNETKNF